MKIAQVAPLWETVPPRTYGGTELVVHLLTQELIRQGHEVTLYACAGSTLSGESGGTLKTCADKPLREMKLLHQDMFTVLSEVRLIGKVLEEAPDFDIIHNHLGLQFLPFVSAMQAPVVTTLHGNFESVSSAFVQEYKKFPYISISDYQRKPCPDLNYVATVYHGLDLDTIEPSYRGDNTYLAFLGRFSPEKGVHHAIDIAKAVGYKLVMAGKVDIADEEYFRTRIEPRIDGSQITFIGEVDHAQKTKLLANAMATLCPVTWAEPFGLVLIESMACGTPVLALRDGSIPEVIDHGRTGFIAETPEELTAYIAEIPTISRKACREHVQRNFSAQRMAADYLKVYKRLLMSRPIPKGDSKAVSVLRMKEKRMRVLLD